MNDNVTASLLDKKLQELPLEIAPETDLWVTLEREITAHQKKKLAFSYGPFAIAASIVVCVLIALVFPRDKMSGEQEVAVLSHPVVEQIASHYELQKTSLLSNVDVNLALTSNWQQQLDDLDRAKVAVQKALEQDPNNIYLISSYKDLHEQSISLLMRVFPVPNESI